MLSRRALLGGLGVALAETACRPEQSHQLAASDPLDRLPQDGATPKVLNIGVTPSAGKETAEAFQPLNRYLAEHHGIDCAVHVSKGYDDLAKLVTDLTVHAGLFSPLAYVKARSTIPAVPIATGTRSGSPTYIGYLIVRGNQPVPLESLRNKRIAWVHKSSTSGYLYPRSMLRWRHIDPDEFFGESIFAGNHLAALRALLDEKVDVAAVAAPFVDPGPRRDPSVQADTPVAVVAKTRRIPLDAFVVHSGLARPLAKRLRQALFQLTFNVEASTGLAGSYGISGFVDVAGPLYDEIAEVLASNA